MTEFRSNLKLNQAFRTQTDLEYCKNLKKDDNLGSSVYCKDYKKKGTILAEPNSQIIDHEVSSHEPMFQKE